MRDKIRKMIEFIGDDPNREGLIDTPDRVIRSWGEIYSGYSDDPAEVLNCTFDGDGYGGPVTLENIDFVSMCEHHMLPFFGTVSITYQPNGRLVGVSKLARLVEVYARRLQIQERMTVQIADALMNNLEAKSCSIEVRATHLCMVMRGVKMDNAVMITKEER